ncbi:site-specific DNA-methyltransferase [Myroides marinus]|uniref:DNA methyltransferase n=1 Tax=Myroides marinus TaxID=703342 RepID=UPI002578C6EF|nr:site-specific DNA-methyltransferase [Myroides marinus]MDM1501204.1 site-specific DNA-methyltransferase [Myroides marinus]
MSLFTHVKSILEQNENFAKDGEVFKNKVVEAALKLDPILLTILLKDDRAKSTFFKEVETILVFDKIKFQKFISNKEFLPDSFTEFKNKIGLTANREYLTEAQEVILDFPYKDCVLEGGQTKDNEKRNEIFWNETLAQDEIDRLYEPKVLSNWKRFDNKDLVSIDNISKNDNLIIKGNNLIALHSLKKIYKGEIKLIYIDPPYNTGKDSFSYNDSFNHSTWLTFMKNRLEVAHELLKQDGVLFISIDVNEQAYLKVLSDEIFGRDNFVGEIIWETATDNNPTQISIEHEHILCYAKNKNILPKWKITSDKAQYIINKYNELKIEFGNDTKLIEKGLRAWINSMKKSNDIDLSGVSHYNYVDDKGVFYPGNSANTKPGGYNFDIIHPITKQVCKKPSNGYRWPIETFNEADINGEVLWPDDENGIPKIKKRIETATELLKGYFYEDNRKSTKALTKIMGRKVFENPKSINLLKKIIKFSTNENDIILDFFAGSGSTAEAVYNVNKELNSNRKYILIEQMDYINEVTMERILATTDGSFVYCELSKLNQLIIDKISELKDFNVITEYIQKLTLNPLIKYSLNEDYFKSILELALVDINAAKKALIECLDKNMLFVPLSESNNLDYNISKEDLKYTNQFYNL